MRLVTRGDLDGLACAVLISLNESIDDLLLIHPQDITDERVEIRDDDILANVPYHPSCAMWFDHHQHTATVAPRPENFEGAFGPAPSAARLVYEFYGGEERWPQFSHFVHETDRLDSAALFPQDVLEPAGWIEIGFTIDGRTGLGDFESYFHKLLELIRESPDIETVSAHPDVKRRTGLMRMLDGKFRQSLQENSRVDGNVVVTDFREFEKVPIGNRFLVYALFPDVNVSARLQWGPDRQWTMMTIGHSIFNRTCRTNVGELAARYGGGGHKGAGSIPLMEDPDLQIQMILAELKRNG